MAISRFLTLALAAGASLLVGCPAAPPPGPTLPVDARGPATAQTPDKEAPDPALLAVARAGVELAGHLGPALSAFTPVLDAVRASRVKHPPQTYRLAQVPGWRFLGGAWLQTDAGDRRLRASIEDPSGQTPGWDVTVEANYGPELHPAFPGNVVRARLEMEQGLPSGARYTATFIVPLAATGQVLEAVGTGAVAVLGPAGSLSVEALNARIGSDGTVERGDLVLKSLGTGTTIQFSGTWSQPGLQAATMIRSGVTAGTLEQAGGGWRFTNAAGSVPL